MNNTNVAKDCPSAPANSNRGKLFGVNQGSPEQPNIAYLRSVVPMSDALLNLSKGVASHQMFRVASVCAEQVCRHYENSKCRLVRQIVENLTPSVDILPACALRVTCRWWVQEGESACFRCPALATEMVTDDPILQKTANCG